MTCVALDKDGYVAWDSLVTAETAKVPYGIDKVWIADGRLYAFAGEIDRMGAVIEWHRAGALAEAAPKGNWDLFVLKKRGAQVFSQDTPFASKVRAPFAMGSGAPYALGALAAGASAFEAVKIAAQYDTNTGGKITTLHRSDVK